MNISAGLVFRLASRVCLNPPTCSASRHFSKQSKICRIKAIKALSMQCSSYRTSNNSLNCLNDVLEQWTKEFQLNKISEPSSSAEFIIAHVLGHKTLYFVDKNQTTLSSFEVSEVNRLCKLRLARMPVQYVIGEWDFHDLTLKMRSPVLIPRPETEELADLCTKMLTQRQVCANKFLEVGSGTGAVSIFLLKIFQKLQGVALDIAPQACKLTTENAEIVGVSDRLHVIEGDFNEDNVVMQLSQHGPYDLIVSNPPYINAEDMKRLQPEILWYEDRQALDGGPDGLDLIREIILRSTQLLVDGGHMWLEVAPQHPLGIQTILEGMNVNQRLTLVDTVKDAFGKDRFCHLQYFS